MPENVKTVIKYLKEVYEKLKNDVGFLKTTSGNVKSD